MAEQACAGWKSRTNSRDFLQLGATLLALCRQKRIVRERSVRSIDQVESVAMTRFVGESINVRQSGRSRIIDGRDRRKYMDDYLRTGKHPLIERTREDNVTSALTPLPTLDINRPHVFMDLRHGNRDLGRLVVELFEDWCPAACAAFRHRCLEGHHTLKGTVIHKLQPQFAAFGGSSSRCAAPALSSRTSLQHIDAGLLSVHKDGSHFAISLGRALALDLEYVIIGRVGKGADIMDELNDVPTDSEEAPLESVLIVQCGVTDHRGRNETLSTAAPSRGDTAHTIEMTKERVQHVTAGVEDAVREGLKRVPLASMEYTELKRRKEVIPGLSDHDESDSTQ